MGVHSMYTIKLHNDPVYTVTRKRKAVQDDSDWCACDYTNTLKDVRYLYVLMDRHVHSCEGLPGLLGSTIQLEAQEAINAS